MEERIKNLESEITLIKERNQKVGWDKAWEISWIRKIFIALSSYLIAAIWLRIINDTDPWLKALVPAIGYLLSTLSLPFVKKWWIQKYEKQ